MNAAIDHDPHDASRQTPSAFFFRYYWLVVAAFAALQMVVAIVIDVRRKLWIDELYTLLVANQPNIREILKAATEGCDGGVPPLYAMLVHALLPLISCVEFAVRLPSTIGYAAMLLFVAAFFRRVLLPLNALAALLLMYLFTFNYGYEGRVYGLALGFAGCALYCWHSMAKNRPSAWHRTLFVISAAMMTALHFYTVFFFVPLFIADLSQALQRRRMNWSVWTAATAAITIVICIHYPVIVTSRKFMQHFWSPALWSLLPDAIFLNVISKYLYAFTLVLFAVAILRYRKRFAEEARSLLDGRVWTAFLLYYLSPMALFAVSVYTTHVYVNRYAMWMLVGAAGLMVALFTLAITIRDRTRAVLVALLFLAAMVTPLRKALEKPSLLECDDAMNEAMALPHDTTAIVVAEHHAFMELYHYAPERLRNRLVYPLNRDLDMRYGGYDTGALLMDAIGKRDHLPVVDYADILTRYKRFYLLASPPHYLPLVLGQDGCSVRALQVRTFSTAYLVRNDGLR